MAGGAEGAASASESWSSSRQSARLWSASKGGRKALVATADIVVEDYRPGGSGKWSGTVYVPDMGHSFPSTITRLGAADLKIRGCLIGGFLCKSQIWHKIEKMPEE